MGDVSWGEFHELSRAVQQLIFRREFDETLYCEPHRSQKFFLVDRLSAYISVLPSILRTCGAAEAFKGFVRIVSGRRFLYGVLENGKIVHYGWVTRGVCRHYEIEESAFVIGPIWSAAARRGRGTATFATRAAINVILNRGGGIVYIDTSESNLPCLRVIEKCQFGPAIGSYDRNN